MDEDLKQYLEGMENRLRGEIRGEIRSSEERTGALLAGVEERTGALIAGLEERTAALTAGVEERTAALIAAELGSLHIEIRAVLDHGKKTGANVTTCIEMIARQSRWHDETDSNAVELLMRVNALEKRVLDLEGGKKAA
jgi:hypothetical protein